MGKAVRLTLFISFILLSAGVQAQVRAVKITEVEKMIAESKTPLIINCWATWCKPCVEEIPYFIEETNKRNNQAATSDSVSLVLVSLDFKESFPDAIKNFATKRNFTAEILWLDETNADYFCPKIDPKWSGAIPATLFINNKTGYRKFYEEQLSHDELKAEMMQLLK
ncbi:MAG TPA: TlpA disulfide reductase family protein [Chitinophagaceae bacterium]|jgi:thiol-disulfide isomerase/thioredoxin|nr:TlpA disulfide reductase family protein [Chitinophagaceae bacterium]HMU59022.1 TlpA disulfide reductase family protein [Chitinophagaceae bacterium]